MGENFSLSGARRFRQATVIAVWEMYIWDRTRTDIYAFAGPCSTIELLQNRRSTFLSAENWFMIVAVSGKDADVISIWLDTCLCRSRLSATDGFDPPTSRLWASRASTAPCRVIGLLAIFNAFGVLLWAS